MSTRAERQEAAKQRKKARERFLSARKVERTYRASLLRIAANIDEMVKTLVQGTRVENDYRRIMEHLQRYSDFIRPWAHAVSERMIKQIGLKDYTSWIELGDSIGVNLRNEIEQAPTGQVMRELMSEQVRLITSLPLEASNRVHKLTIEGITKGLRAEELTQEILKTGEVTAARARTIARTEISRTAGALTEARAKHIGSEGYIWHTVGDSDVRDDHKELNGKFIRWDDPPIADKKTGARAHAGCIYNCRCWAEPVLPDIIE